MDRASSFIVGAIGLERILLQPRIECFFHKVRLFLSTLPFLEDIILNSYYPEILGKSIYLDCR